MNNTERYGSESARLAALRSLGVLDTAAESEFDVIVEMAAYLCNKSVALISLVDADRLWLKAQVGLSGVSEMKRERSFCDKTIASTDLIEVTDALQSPVFSAMALVTGPTAIRFYAGISLQLSSGERVGTLCVLDQQPGQLDARQRALLHKLAGIAVRVLEARKVQHELRARQEELGALQARERRSYEATPALLYAIDPQGRILNASEQLLRKLGYTRGEVIGAHITDFMSMPSKLHALEFGLPQLLREGTLENRPYQLVSHQGEVIDVLISATLERDAEGNPLRALSHVEDVTQRLLIEKTLADERKHLRNIVNGTSSGTWELDLVTGNHLINETYAQMQGYSVAEMAELLAGNFQNIVHEDDREHVSVQWEAHLSGMTTEYEAEFRVRHREGHWVWILSRGKVGARDANDRPLSISGIHLDISARRNAIEMANRAMHDMQNTLDALPSRVVYWDRDLHFRFGNKAFRDRFSQPGQDLTGKSMRVILGEELYARNVEALRGIDDGRQRQFEQHAVLPSGDVERFIIRYLPDMMDGKVQGYYVFVFDITQIKAAQAQLEALNTELAERSAQAEAASVSKSAFLASMSHEIRTPMNAILGMHALIQKTSLTPRQLDYLKKSERAAKSLLGLLNDILDYSKVEAGKLSLDPQSFRTDELLDELSVIFSAYVGNKPVEVLFDVGPGLPEVAVGDALRIKQVLINLGGNAIKFTEQGAVVIQIAWDGVCSDLSRTRFSVKDSGIGIAPENQRHIFDGFSQAEASTTRKFGGTGLGLAISKRLVEMMGGYIQLDSALGVGSTFSFELQLPALSEVPLALRRERPAHAVHRVMVIDDHQLSGELLRIAGRSLSWDVELCSSGAQGIRRLVEVLDDPLRAFDLVLIDWQMPEMDGWETARQLREVTRAVQRQPIMLMVSANSMELVSHRTDEEQALLDGFLSKPVTPAMLSGAVMAAVNSDRYSPLPDQGASLRRLDGMHILVVEDNLINQQVAEELLLSEGARVSLAANGEQGVRAIQTASPPYDAVLMDIQMPVMDGYAAARHIRNVLQLQELPIIGLTANAMVQDRNDCFAAGMNEHVGKPFDMEQLVEVLLRLTGFRPKSVQPEPSLGVRGTDAGVLASKNRAPIPEMVTADIDLPAALQRMSGMQAMYLRAAKDFYRMLHELLPTFDALLDSSDMLAASTFLHTYKGTAGTVGLTRLAKELTRLEQLCKSGSEVSAVRAQSMSLGTTVKMAMAALEAAALSLGHPFDGPAATPSMAVSAHAAVQHTGLDAAGKSLLAALGRMANEGDLAVLQQFAEQRDMLAGAGERLLAELEEALQALDLDQVAALCALGSLVH